MNPIVSVQSVEYHDELYQRYAVLRDQHPVYFDAERDIAHREAVAADEVLAFKLGIHNPQCIQHRRLAAYLQFFVFFRVVGIGIGPAEQTP